MQESSGVLSQTIFDNPVLINESYYLCVSECVMVPMAFIGKYKKKYKYFEVCDFKAEGALSTNPSIPKELVDRWVSLGELKPFSVFLKAVLTQEKKFFVTH